MSKASRRVSRARTCGDAERSEAEAVCGTKPILLQTTAAARDAKITAGAQGGVGHKFMRGNAAIPLEAPGAGRVALAQHPHTPMNPARFLALILPFAASGLSAQNVSILSYEYLLGPNGDYKDTSLTKLTDGIAIVPAWVPDGQGIADTSPFVGWDSTPGLIAFNFADNTLINSATFYFADSMEPQG